MSLDQLALNNLTILSKFNSKKQFLSITNKNKLNINDKEEQYESITTLSDLEYPIYFSFHHIFTMINNNKNNNVLNRKKIINLMNKASHNIYNTYDDVLDDEYNKQVVLIMDHIDTIITIIDDYYFRFYYYNRFIETFNYFVSGFNKCKVVMKECTDELYGISDDEDDADNADDNDSDDKECNDSDDKECNDSDDKDENDNSDSDGVVISDDSDDIIIDDLDESHNKED